MTLAAAAGLVAAVLAFSSDAQARLHLSRRDARRLRPACASSHSLIMAGARRLPHARHVALRLAIGNIHRPGALTPSVVLSLGLGLALLVALTLIDGNIRGELKTERSPARRRASSSSTSRAAKAEAFAQFIKAHAPDGELELVPMLRGRIVRLNGLSGRCGAAEGERRLGAAGRSRDHLRRRRAGGLDPGQGRMVAEGLYRAAADFAGERSRRRARAHDRR